MNLRQIVDDVVDLYVRIYEDEARLGVDNFRKRLLVLDGCGKQDEYWTCVLQEAVEASRREGHKYDLQMAVNFCSRLLKDPLKAGKGFVGYFKMLWQYSIGENQ